MPEEINHTTIRVGGSRAKSRRMFKMGGNAVDRPWAADEFATIRARIEELRRERAAAQASVSDLPRDLPQCSARYGYGSQPEINAAPGRVRQSGSMRG